VAICDVVAIATATEDAAGVDVMKPARECALGATVKDIHR
jgi:hypothetical protein